MYVIVKSGGGGTYLKSRHEEWEVSLSDSGKLHSILILGTNLSNVNSFDYQKKEIQHVPKWVPS